MSGYCMRYGHTHTHTHTHRQTQGCATLTFRGCRVLGFGLVLSMFLDCARPRAKVRPLAAPLLLPPLPPLEALLSETGATNPTSTTVSQALGPVLLSKAFARVRTVALVAIALSALVAD